MALFKCLQSHKTVNYDTGADFGETTVSTFFVPNTPIDYNSITGFISDGAAQIQSFIVLVDGSLQLTNIGGTHSTHVVSGTINVQTGKLELTWNVPPGTNSALLSYTGGPIFKFVTSKLFYVSCPVVNQTCNKTSNAFVAAITVCNQNLYV